MYKSLMKVFFKENLSARRILGTDPKKSKGKTILVVFAMLYALAAFLFVFGTMFMDLGEMLYQMGSIDVLLIYAFMYSTALTAIFVIFRANGYLFNYKDYEILEPLPIRGHTVIRAKLTVMLVFVYGSTFIFLAPIMFSYFYHGGFDVLSLIIFFIGFTTIPLIPTIIFSFISLLIGRLTARFKKNNILNIIFMFVIFIGIMVLNFSLSSMGDNNPLLNQSGFMTEAGKYFPPIKWFVEAVSSHNIVSLLLLLMVTIGLFIGFVFVIQGLVKATNQRNMTKHVSKNNKVAKAKQSSILTTIAKKEAKTFISTTIYAFNSGFGVVIMLLAGIAAIIFRADILEFFGMLAGTPLDIGGELIILIFFGFCISMTCTTAISLSLEGKQFWVIKSLPIKPVTVMYGKMLFNVLLILPVALISLVMITIALNIEISVFIILLLFIVSLTFLITVFGSVINLWLPKFEWRNATEVVKQSAAVLLAVFGSWALLILDGFVVYKLLGSMELNLIIIIISLINILLTIIGLIYVNKKTESLFIKFEV